MSSERVRESRVATNDPTCGCHAGHVCSDWGPTPLFVGEHQLYINLRPIPIPSIQSPHEASSYLEPSSSSSTPPPLCRAPPSPSPSDTFLVFLRSTIMPAAAAAAKVRARLLRHRRRSRRSNPPALEWMTRSVAAQRRGWVTFPSCSYRNSHIRLWRQNSSQDVDCGRPHHSTPAPLRAATLSTKLRDRRPPQSVCGVVRPFVGPSSGLCLSLPLSLSPSPHL